MLSRELLLLEGLALQGFGNWQAIAEHIGTRTKEDVAKHYQTVFIDSPHWPLPVCLLHTLNDHESDLG
jgi:transcriptional adapter 2-alpha